MAAPALAAVAALLTFGVLKAGLPVVVVVGLGIFVVIAAVLVLSVPSDQLAFSIVAILVVFITWNGFRLGNLAVASPLLVPAFGAVVAYWLAARRAPAVPPWLLAAAMLFIAAALINIIFPPRGSLINETLIHYRSDARPRLPAYIVPRSDLILLAQFLVGVVLVPVMIAAVATTRRRIDRLIDAWTISAAVNGAVGLVQLATGTTRAEALTLHPNYLALACALAIPTAFLWVNRGGRWRIPGFVALALLLGGEYASGSRSSAVAALLAIVATLAALPKLRRGLKFAMPLVGIAVLAVLVFTSAGGKVASQLRFGGDQQTRISTAGSNTAREHLAGTALNQFEARPLQGIGFGVIEDAHDIYLQLLAAGGLLAAAGFLVFVGGVIDSWMRARAGPLRDAAWALGISFVTYLANGALTAELADKQLFVVPGLLLAMSYVAASVARRPAAEPIPPGFAGARAIGGAPAAQPGPAMVAPTLSSAR